MDIKPQRKKTKKKINFNSSLTAVILSIVCVSLIFIIFTPQLIQYITDEGDSGDAGDTIVGDTTYTYNDGTDLRYDAIQDGRHYFIKGCIDVIGAGNVTYVMFITPIATWRVHAMAFINAEAEFLLEIYENGTVSNNGTYVTPMNNLRCSTRLAGLMPYTNPTVTNDGNLMWLARVGVARESGVTMGLTYEIIVKPNTIYIWKLTKEAAGTHYLDYDFFWYETEN